MTQKIHTVGATAPAKTAPHPPWPRFQSACGHSPTSAILVEGPSLGRETPARGGAGWGGTPARNPAAAPNRAVFIVQSQSYDESGGGEEYGGTRSISPRTKFRLALRAISFEIRAARPEAAQGKKGREREKGTFYWRREGEEKEQTGEIRNVFGCFQYFADGGRMEKASSSAG